jgi:hypothetical protein
VEGPGEYFVNIDAIGNDHHLLAAHPQFDQDLALRFREDDGAIVVGQTGGIELIGQVLGAGGDVAPPSVKSWVESGH